MEHTEHKQAPVKPGRISPGGMILGVVFMLVVLIGLGFFFFTRIVEGYKAVRLLPGHQVTHGAIYKSGGYRTNSHYTVTIEGKTYTGEAGQYPSRGDAIEIAFLQGNASINRPKDGLWGDAIFGIAFAIGVCIAVIAIAYGLLLDMNKFADRVVSRPYADG